MRAVIPHGGAVYGASELGPRGPKTGQLLNKVVIPLAALLLAIGLTTPVFSTQYYVAIDHQNSSDSNSGLSLNQPFETLERAVQDLSPGDTLNIKAGVYREVIQLPRSGTANNPIVIRAYPGDEGAVAIRGSDAVSGWTNVGSNIWRVDRQALPLVTYPSSWPDMGPLSKRREMVFLDGVPLSQTLSSGGLASGTFFVDRSAGKYYVYYSGNLNNRLVEVATRDKGINAYWIDHVRWVGVTVEHIANDATTPAMALRSNHEIRRCQINNNNQVGIKGYHETKIIESTANRNGRVGIALNGSGSFLDSSETSFNGWRYGPRWDAGGLKMIYDRPANNHIVRHVARFNNGRGVWLDTTSSGNIVEASFFEGNTIVALEFEATQGPNWAINNVIVGTMLGGMAYPQEDGVGIGVREAQDTYLFNNTIVDVAGAGILVSGNERNNGEDFIANTLAINNIVVGSGSAAVQVWVWGEARTGPRLGSHNFDNNLYFDSATTIIFPNLNGGGDLHWSLAQWQANRGEDLDSLAQAPRFVNRSALEFALLEDSPAVDSGEDIPEVSEDFQGCMRPMGYSTEMGAFEYCMDPGGPPPIRIFSTHGSSSPPTPGSTGRTRP